MKIKFTRDSYGERIKDLKFVLSKINENCNDCCQNISDKYIKDQMAYLQGDTEKHLELLDRIIRIVESKETIEDQEA